MSEAFGVQAPLDSSAISGTFRHRVFTLDATNTVPMTTFFDKPCALGFVTLKVESPFYATASNKAYLLVNSSYNTVAIGTTVTFNPTDYMYNVLPIPNIGTTSGGVTSFTSDYSGSFIFSRSPLMRPNFTLLDPPAVDSMKNFQFQYATDSRYRFQIAFSSKTAGANLTTIGRISMHVWDLCP